MSTDNALRRVGHLSVRLTADMSAFTDGVGRARRRMDDFYGAWRRAMEKEYLAAHGRLPGSTRTRRLRKKREDAVYRWWSEQR